jgi:hypothetical protein
LNRRRADQTTGLPYQIFRNWRFLGLLSTLRAT